MQSLTIKNIKHALMQAPGFYSKRKLVVFESDDWGSIRMPNKEVFSKLKEILPGLENLSYQKYDTLASKEDLELLFATLQEYHDKKGNHPVITANTIVANPDFERIKSSDYKTYYYEPFTETLSSYYGYEVFEKWQEGIKKGVFFPQFHGREHLNVKRWMQALQQNIGYTRLAFENGLFDLSDSLVITENSFMDALDIETNCDISNLNVILKDGLDLFEKIFGYRSKTFIAPCYVWPSEIEATIADSGIIALQGSWYQKQPIQGKPGKYKNIFHYTGQKSKYGLYYIVRNAAFEPSDNPNFNWIDEILFRASIAFKMGKPLVVSTHRINFIGTLKPSNRDNNLALFKNLIEKLLQEYPDLEFIHTAQLAELLSKND
jgi:hypothetical protein